MDGTQPRTTTLKRGAKRTAEIETDARGERFFVKRFHSPGRFDRHLDERRARRELANLVRLRELSIPVCEPIEVRRREGRHELVTRWVESSAPLLEVLSGDADGFGTLEQLAGSIGSVLARLQECGIDHPDLHAGNALALKGGTIALVDAHGLRFRARLSAARKIQALVHVCASARETVPARFRARVFLAWWRALSTASQEELPARNELVQIIEERARLSRRDTVVRSSLRWMRPSSVAVRVSSPARGHASKLFTQAEILAASSGERSIAGRAWLRSSADARAHYATAARLYEHGIATAVPVLLMDVPKHRAWFALPLDTRSIDLRRARQSERVRIAVGLGALCGALADRGIHLEQGSILFDRAFRAILDAGARIGPSHTFVLSSALARIGPSHTFVLSSALAPVAGLRTSATRMERARFIVAFLRAWRGDARERERVRASLVHG